MGAVHAEQAKLASTIGGLGACVVAVVDRVADVATRVTEVEEASSLASELVAERDASSRVSTPPTLRIVLEDDERGEGGPR